MQRPTVAVVDLQIPDPDGQAVIDAVEDGAAGVRSEPVDSGELSAAARGLRVLYASGYDQDVLLRPWSADR